jgi:hypothetical protein
MNDKPIKLNMTFKEALEMIAKGGSSALSKLPPKVAPTAKVAKQTANKRSSKR